MVIRVLVFFQFHIALPTNTSQDHQYVVGRYFSGIGNYGGLLCDKRCHNRVYQISSKIPYSKRDSSQRRGVSWSSDSIIFGDPTNAWAYYLCSPGAIYTPIQADTRDARQMEGWGRGAGLGRPGEPSEVATSFVFLASADASLYCKLKVPEPLFETQY